MRTRIARSLPVLALSFSALWLAASCASDPPVRVVTEAETVDILVEVYKPLPEALVRPVPYPQGLSEGFTVEDVIDLAFDLYDALDQANADKAQAGQLSQPSTEEALPE